MKINRGNDEFLTKFYPICGDGLVVFGEDCDEGGANIGCTSSCFIKPGWHCSSNPPGSTSICWEECGDGMISESEECDDGGRTPGDGCSFNC